jgi:chromosome segregation ATPase
MSNKEQQMANATTQLSNMIEELVQQKTFGLDALEAIRTLKTKAEALEESVKNKNEVIERLQAEARALNERLSHQGEQLTQISARELAVAKREAEIQKLEVAAAVAQAESRTFRHALGVVFAPNTVRESVQRFGSTVSNGMTFPTNEGGTTQHTQGYGSPDNPGQVTGNERSHLG